MRQEPVERHLAPEPRIPSRASAGIRLLCCCVACFVVSAVAAPDDAPSRQARGEQSETRAPAARRGARAPLPPHAPLPPRRPQAPQPPPGETPSAPAPLPELPPLDTSVPPPSLPRAPRTRMRVCATQWLKIKQEGQAGATTWRDFATKCLTR